jgi:hypothetical protein
MTDQPQTPGVARPRRFQEYEDPHFHDDDEVATPDEGQPRGPTVPGRRYHVRRPPPPRRHDED